MLQVDTEESRHTEFLSYWANTHLDNILCTFKCKAAKTQTCTSTLTPFPWMRVFVSLCLHKNPQGQNNPPEAWLINITDASDSTGRPARAFDSGAAWRSALRQVETYRQLHTHWIKQEECNHKPLPGLCEITFILFIHHTPLVLFSSSRQGDRKISNNNKSSLRGCWVKCLSHVYTMAHVLSRVITVSDIPVNCAVYALLQGMHATRCHNITITVWPGALLPI